jgi:predicted GNAT family acetyltransferase
MLVQHKEDETTGKFFVEQDGNLLAEMVYAKEPGRMIIEHTEVDESLRGRNIGLQLVENGIEFAREQRLKIIPLCQFAKKVIEEHPEFQDVL